jgi:hypothetical protein
VQQDFTVQRDKFLALVALLENTIHQLEVHLLAHAYLAHPERIIHYGEAFPNLHVSPVQLELTIHSTEYPASFTATLALPEHLAASLVNLSAPHVQLERITHRQGVAPQPHAHPAQLGLTVHQQQASLRPPASYAQRGPTILQQAKAHLSHALSAQPAHTIRLLAKAFVFLVQLELSVLLVNLPALVVQQDHLEHTPLLRESAPTAQLEPTIL